MNEDATGYRVSPEQRRQWSLDDGCPTTRGAVSALIRLAPETPTETIEEALTALIRRHEILRTRLACPPGLHLPVQRITPPEKVSIRLESVDAASRIAAGDPLDAPPAPFDPQAGECLRARLLHGDGALHLRLELSGYCADVAGLRPLLEEFAALLGGARPPREPLQFADLSEWRNQLLEDEESAEGIAYWRRRLEALGPAPAPRWINAAEEPPRPARLPLPATVADDALAAAAVHGVTPEDWLLGGWSALLWRLTEEGAPAMALIPTRRGYDELADAVGPLAVPLPLAGVTPAGSETLAALAARLALQREEALAWQDYLAWPAGEKSAAGEATEPPPIGFSYFEPGTPEGATKGSAGLLDLTILPDRVALLLEAVNGADGLRLAIVHDAARVDTATTDRLRGQLVTLLADAGAHPERPLERLRLLPEEQRRELLERFSRGRDTTPPAGDARLQGLVERQSRVTPGRTALAYPGGSLSYRELWAEVERAAGRLRGFGIGPGHRVALLQGRGPALIVNLLAVLDRGAAYLPLEPSHPDARLIEIIEDADPALILTDPGEEDRLGGGYPLHTLDTLPERGAGPATVRPAGAADPAAYILYTSGSTGRPKGVVVGHRSLLNHMYWMAAAYPPGEEERVLFKTPFSFDASVWEIFLPLMSGARLVLAKPDGHRDVAYLVETIRREAITTLQVVPTLLGALLEQPRFAECRSLKRLFCGGEALRRELAERLTALLPVTLINLYGPTEATIQVTHHRFEGGRGDSPWVPIGRPIDNARIYLLDPCGEPVPVGVEGEIHIGGLPPAHAYFRREALSAERFLPDPIVPGEGQRIYRTGDLGVWLEDGALEFRGRRDHQVKFRGYRVELGEIESIAREHPLVGDACVLSRAGEERYAELICYLTPAPGAFAGRHGDSALIRAHMNQRLPAYLVPSRFIMLSRFPLTTSGKVDRNALPAPETVHVDGERRPPADELELRLLDLWQRVLKVGNAGVDDDFFELGGHSLLAVTLMAEIEKEFERDLPLSLLFDAPTVARMGARLREACEPANPRPLVTLRKGNGARPLFFVHPTGGNVLCYFDLAQRMAPNQPFYALQDPGLVNGGADYDDLPQLAALYLREVRGVQPKGPYLLGGWSSGGVIAFEMAQQLLAEGEEVGLLALIDSQAPLRSEATGTDDERLFHAVARLLAFQSGREVSVLQLPEGEEARFALLLELARDARLVAGDAGEEQVRRLFRVFRKNVKVVGNYHAREYPRRILLFRASDPLPEAVRSAAVHNMSEDATFEWDRIGNVQIHDVPGHHLNMIAAPQVESLSGALAEAVADTNRVYDLGNRMMFWMYGH